MDYSAEVRRRFEAPIRAGEFPPGTASVVTAAAEDRSLNVWVRFQVQARAGTIAELRFSVFGCPHTVAAADWIAEQLTGAPVGMLRHVDLAAVTRALAIPRDKLGKLLRIEDALVACADLIESAAKGSE